MKPKIRMPKISLGKKEIRGVLDYETTGFDKKIHGIYEVCLKIIDKDYKVIDSYTALVKPYFKRGCEPDFTPLDGEKMMDTMKRIKNEKIKEEDLIEHGCEKIHGITREMVVNDGIDPMQITQAIDEMLFTHRCRIIVAHGAKFEEGWTNEFWERFGGEDRLNVDEWQDTCVMSKEKGGSKSHSLENLCKKYGIVNQNPHRAEGDVDATIKLLEILETT